MSASTPLDAFRAADATATTPLDAFRAGDANASREAHVQKGVAASGGAVELHGGAGADYIKSLVFGGVDGVITTFSLVASVSGGQFSMSTVLVLGFAKCARLPPCAPAHPPPPRAGNSHRTPPTWTPNP